ncbi:hypothetical protein [Variovorax sp. HJSM1_2]|uniref:hypothetical protein n=1 Tax=Variovorax sp. HJSM1_2 TaxID=3366263 RepID=UPI003BECBCB8
MDQKVYVSNDTDAAKFIGGKLLQPGEGREFDRDAVPGEFLPGGDEAGNSGNQGDRTPIRADEILAFYQGANAAQLIAAVPEYSAEDLALLESFELERKQPRSTVLAAVQERRLTLADGSLGGDGGGSTPPAGTGNGEQT